MLKCLSQMPATLHAFGFNPAIDKILFHSYIFATHAHSLLQCMLPTPKNTWRSQSSAYSFSNNRHFPPAQTPTSTIVTPPSVEGESLDSNLFNQSAIMLRSIFTAPLLTDSSSLQTVLICNREDSRPVLHERLMWCRLPEYLHFNKAYALG